MAVSISLFINRISVVDESKEVSLHTPALMPGLIKIKREKTKFGSFKIYISSLLLVSKFNAVF